MQKSNTHNIKNNDESLKPSMIYSERFRIVIASGIAVTIVFFLSFYLSTFSDTNSTRDIGFIFAVLVAVLPLALLQLKEVQRKENIDRNLPLFLLALVSSVQSGSNLIRAIEHSAERNMGALTPQLKNLKANISWGMPIGDALENFAQ